ncbi:MAG: glycosyltransferase [Candidatus Omnitrophota bacterium]
MKHLRISVALCSYNGERFLEEQLNSIACQTCLPDELIICDDGSTDRTTDIVRAFADKSAFPVRFAINENKLGVVKNFERSIRLCSGDIIVLSDQDDIWMPAKLDEIKNKFLQDPNLYFVASDALLVDERCNSLGYTVWQENGFLGRIRDEFEIIYQLRTLLKIGSVTPGCTLAFSSRIPGWIFPLPGELKTGHHEDWIILLLTVSGHKGFFIKDPLVQYRQHNLQTTGGIKIGVARIKKIFHSAPETFDQIESLYVTALSRLESNKVCSDDVRRLMTGKIAHIKARRKIWHLPLYSRLPEILNEIMLGRYSRFSLGCKSVIRDSLIYKDEIIIKPKKESS